MEVSWTVVHDKYSLYSLCIVVRKKNKIGARLIVPAMSSSSILENETLIS